MSRMQMRAREQAQVRPKAFQAQIGGVWISHQSTCS
jgi:hypothetical protein